jgi:hypothetical protein
MRDPASHFHAQSEVAVEDICGYLKRYMQSEWWKADPDGLACDMRTAIDEVELSNLPDWAKNFAVFALLEQTKKRRGKPTRHHRDMAIEMAAIRLVLQGYTPTRNEASRNRASASSIIREALRRLGENLSEKSINLIVAKSDVLKNPDGLEMIRRVWNIPPSAS